jgi:hypothetical protein
MIESEKIKMMGDIIVALTKLAGGTIWLAHTTLERDPNEAVYIEKQANGSLVLTLKNVTTIQEVTDA